MPLVAKMNITLTTHEKIAICEKAQLELARHKAKGYIFYLCPFFTSTVVKITYYSDSPEYILEMYFPEFYKVPGYDLSKKFPSFHPYDYLARSQFLNDLIQLLKKKLPNGK